MTRNGKLVSKVVNQVYLLTCPLFHHPYHQRPEKVNFRAETVVVLHLLPGTSNVDIPASI